MAGLSPTPEVTLYAVRGETMDVSFRFSWVPATATASWTATFVARLRQRDGLSPYITKNLVWITPDPSAPDEGLARLLLTSAETAMLPPTDCVHYLNLTESGGDPARIVQGDLKVSD